MKTMKQLLASYFACLLLSLLLVEPALCRGGRGGSRGSSRGTSSRASSNAGKYPGGAARSRYRSTGRSSAVRVAAAAAAGAAVAVALTADGWYASAYRRTKTDASDEDVDYYHNNSSSNYFEALMSRSTQHVFSLTHVTSLIILTCSPAYGAMMDYGLFY